MRKVSELRDKFTRVDPDVLAVLHRTDLEIVLFLPEGTPAPGDRWQATGATVSVAGTAYDGHRLLQYDELSEAELPPTFFFAVRPAP